MTCGITVAPRMPAASSTLSVPSNRGTKSPCRIPVRSGSDSTTWTANDATMTRMRPAMTDSSRRNPFACSARIANAATPVRSAAGKSAMPNRSWSPIAAPMNSAEFMGAAIGLQLLFGIALFPAALLTGVAAFAILALQAKGFRRLESVIAGLILVIVASFAVQVVLSDPDRTGILHGLFVPRFDGTESVLLAAGILGATVMPHVIYLHSALTQHRIVGANDEARRRIFHFERVDVIIAMGIAGVINLSMLITAAAVFHDKGLVDVGDDLGDVYD